MATSSRLMEVVQRQNRELDAIAGGFGGSYYAAADAAEDPGEDEAERCDSSPSERAEREYFSSQCCKSRAKRCVRFATRSKTLSSCAFSRGGGGEEGSARELFRRQPVLFVRAFVVVALAFAREEGIARGRGRG